MSFVLQVAHGEKNAADESSASQWKDSRMKELLLQYKAKDIYNADETSLYYRAMPDRTHALNREKVSGGKKNKERVTAMVCANMDGSDKRKLMIILQPMDMGIISCLKKVCRRQMCDKLIASFDPESTEPINIETQAISITLLDAITMGCLGPDNR